MNTTFTSYARRAISPKIFSTLSRMRLQQLPVCVSLSSRPRSLPAGGHTLSALRQHSSWDLTDFHHLPSETLRFSLSGRRSGFWSHHSKTFRRGCSLSLPWELLQTRLITYFKSSHPLRITRFPTQTHTHTQFLGWVGMGWMLLLYWELGTGRRGGEDQSNGARSSWEFCESAG